MAEGDPAESLEGDNRGDGFGNEGEHGSWPGVEQQRFVIVDEVLVEGEACRSDVGDERREPEDAVGNFVDASVHESSPCDVGGGGRLTKSEGGGGDDGPLVAPPE